MITNQKLMSLAPMQKAVQAEEIERHNREHAARMAAVVEAEESVATLRAATDEANAEALAAHLAGWSTAYIEAGSMHYALYPMLRTRIPKPAQISPVFLAHQALKTLGVKEGHLFGPGDQLTLMYLFQPNINGNSKETLLAARALIYTKLIEKEEMSADLNTFPHVRNELDCIRIVKALTLDDCERLFPLIRRINTAAARLIVHDYFAKIKKRPLQRMHIKSF